MADKKIPIDFKNAFERCLNDEKQIDYFYDNITPFLVDYDTTILTNLTLYLGFIFAVLVYKSDKSQKNDQTLIDNFCYWLIQVIKLIKDTYSESYHKAFKQSYNKQNFTTFNTQIIKDILNDALCFFYSYYKIYTSGHIPQIVDIVPLVQEAKKKKIDTIHYRKLFKTGINDRHIDKCVDIFYDKYSPQHDTPAIDRIYKEIIKFMLKTEKQNSMILFIF